MLELPQQHPRSFRATLHGTCFGDREALIDDLEPESRIALVPDPPVEEDPQVWVHAASGRPLGHLPPEIGAWLAPWLQRGGLATAHVLRVHGQEVPSWRRVVVQVECLAG